MNLSIPVNPPAREKKKSGSRCIIAWGSEERLSHSTCVPHCFRQCKRAAALYYAIYVPCPFHDSYAPLRFTPPTRIFLLLFLAYFLLISDFVLPHYTQLLWLNCESFLRIWIFKCSFFHIKSIPQAVENETSDKLEPEWWHGWCSIPINFQGRRSLMGTFRQYLNKSSPALYLYVTGHHSIGNKASTRSLECYTLLSRWPSNQFSSSCFPLVPELQPFWSFLETGTVPYPARNSHLMVTTCTLGLCI